MISKKYHRSIKKYVKKLQRFANRFWFPPLLLTLALLDALVIIIPTDGILISSSMLIKKRWGPFALSVAIGSTIGALILVYFVHHHGLQKILEFYPTIDQSQAWKWTLNFFNQYGLLVVFLIGVTPLTQQPILIMAALSNISFFPLALIILISRLIKFSVMAYIASHTPRLLSKLWGVKDEMQDAGVKIE
jgi:membrane protein YqaA with SNARE-associated domain